MVLRINEHDTEGYIHHKVGLYAAYLLVEKHLTMTQVVTQISKKLIDHKTKVSHSPSIRRIVRNIYTEIFTTTS